MPDLDTLLSEMEAAYAALDIDPAQQWYALIGKDGYDLCLENARYRPGQESSGPSDILGRFACGGFAIRALPVVARAMNLTPTLIAEFRSLLAEREWLRAGLAPFAKAAAAFDYWVPEAMPDLTYPVNGTDTSLALEDCPQAIGSLAADDFRRARTALNIAGDEE